MRKFLFCAFFIFINFGGFAQPHLPKFTSSSIFQTEYFIENKGQFKNPLNSNDKVYFSTDHKGMQVHFSQNGFVWEFHKVVRKSKEQIAREKISNDNKEKKYTVTNDNIAMKWIGANPSPSIEGVSKTSHYFPYGEPSLNSYGYKKIIYKSLYPGIDAEYVVHSKGGLKYSLIMAPNAEVSQVLFHYPGREVYLDGKNLLIKTLVGDFVETGLKAFYENGDEIPCEFTLTDQQVGFKFMGPIQHGRKIIIDPWVTPITSLTNSSGAGVNKGFDVDYDYQGNLYVFGGGDYVGAINSKVAKYDPLGNLLWTFNGQLVSPAWNSGAQIGKVSNFYVDKLSGSFYMGQGYTWTGTVIVRLNTNGNYDNFISTANASYEEVWEMNVDCNTGTILGFGGGTSSNSNLGIITSSGNLTLSNLSGQPEICQDILNSTMSYDGEMYVAMVSPLNTNYLNCIMKVNPTLNGNNWIVSTGLTIFAEADNKPSLSAQGSNGFNALSATTNYLFYYDGQYVRAYDKTNGSLVGTQFTLASNVAKFQGGIYADECNHVYVGGNNGNIHVFDFNGSSFTPLPDIVFAGQANKHVYDMKFNGASGLLYVSGEEFVATVERSQTCLDTLTASTQFAFDCSRAIINLSNANPAFHYTYIWTDSTTNTIVQNHSGQGLMGDTLNTMVSGNVYFIQVIKNASCGGSSQIVRFVGSNVVTYNNTPVLCYGQNCVVNGHTYSQSGVYADTIQATVGCDTVINTNLTILDKLDTTLNVDICDGQQFIVNGHSYSQSGTYTDTVKNAIGCDSIITTHLTNHLIEEKTQNIQLCNGNTYSINNHTYSTSGVYLDTLQSSIGCDSIITSIINVDTTGSSSFFIPSVFSPNGDSKNDCISLKYWPQVEKLDFKIFNRWGELVFSTHDRNECWDGFIRKRYADIGTYFYYINAKTVCGDIIKKGDIQLIR